MAVTPDSERLLVVVQPVLFTGTYPLWHVATKDLARRQDMPVAPGFRIAVAH